MSSDVIGSEDKPRIPIVHSTQHVGEFDKLTHLDNWKTTMLLKIKKNMDAEPGLS